MFCFHFVAGDRLSRNILYWSFASRVMFMGSAFGVAFFASVLRNALPFWCPLFVWLVFQQCSDIDPTCSVECIISDVVFRVFLQYSRLRQLACSQLKFSFARASSMSDHFCPSSVVLSAVRMMWHGDAKTRRAAPPYLPRQNLKALINHRNSLENTQEHIAWLIKCLHCNTKLLYGQEKSITPGGKLVLPW